ncbi:MAG TPA: hypothetical protein VFJ48_10535 [Casimicrobiaceae bacterium]|nr:hypothetical protein [Casimicrobiaceae bacterium]
MRSYETSMPRTSLGLAAIALSVITFALTVMLPAGFYSGRIDEASTTLAKSAAPEVIEVSIIPSRIEVTGQCEQSMAYEPARRVRTVDHES